jgi:hypothetical protein
MDMDKFFQGDNLINIRGRVDQKEADIGNSKKI